MHKFPSIEQFRHVIRHVRDNASFHGVDIPTAVTFVGTVKLHGTNGGIDQQNGKITYLSRNRVLQPGDDNAGFAGHMEAHRDSVEQIFARIRSAWSLGDDVQIQLFGEWCGEGIQRGVAIAQLPKMFVIFACRVGDEWYGPTISAPEAAIYCIHDFPTYEIQIDFTKPELAQNTMVEITEKVEAECPVGAKFGVSGIGEGVVWKPWQINGMVTPTLAASSELWFKVKGEKHSVTKVHKLAAVDVERIADQYKLVESLVTSNRLDQGLDHFLNEEKLELKIQNIGVFLRWVFGDIAKEEADTIEASGFTVKELGKPVSDVAKRYFMKALDQAAVA